MHQLGNEDVALILGSTMINQSCKSLSVADPKGITSTGQYRTGIEEGFRSATMFLLLQTKDSKVISSKSYIIT